MPAQVGSGARTGRRRGSSSAFAPVDEPDRLKPCLVGCSSSPASVPAAALRASVRAHAGEDAELLVVAPASDISRLDWLTNAEDDARTDAAERADELAEAAPTDEVESRVGDSDPVKAIEDALRTFPADELIVVTLPDEDAAWLEKGSADTALDRFSLPVTHLVVEN